MKTLVTLSTSLVLAATILVGCGDGSSSYKDKMNKNVTSMEDAKQKEELAKKEAAAKKQAEIFSAQPGDITLRGVIVTQDEQKKLGFDPRLSTEILPGKLDDGTAAGLEKDKVPKLFEQVADTFKIADENIKKFANLGCQDLTEGDKSGLEELKVEFGNAESKLKIEATKVFICGEQKIPVSSFIIVAQEVILRDAKITNDESVNNFFGIATKTLRLTGSNSITNQVSNKGKTPDIGINLSVSGELLDQGKLSLVTKGREVAVAKKEAEETKKDTDDSKKDTDDYKKDTDESKKDTEEAQK